MAILKCKLCGGDLNVQEGVSTAECEYCGSLQTVPNADNEKKLQLFGRANRLRANCDFDKAAGIYETIVTDFPDEAEAYWGLVLCKYGIEYVDDPGTGKKIPTCHRSSYDEVLADENFEQAMENADVVAQRLYREEAKEIERLRRGILEISNAEKPYDIFICYKETDEKGNRTIDSVLAQNLYERLTDKGYRVFFARITLQGKLGEAYEPYIFAALNSAKVMLVVGTRYEYFNAVWVKNEWSRYLKICAADKDRHLFPCYKDILPEDMPREFAHLQGADLGQIGADQDIVFNIQKYIPLRKQTQTTVSQGPSGNEAMLLKRGNMALEDGDWSSAGSFFEQALNSNPECAEAYLGKALAGFRYKDLDELVRRELYKARSNHTTATVTIPESGSRIMAAINQHAVPGYLEAADIQKIYYFDRSFQSAAEGWRKQKQNIIENVYQDRNLNRAKQFATGDLSNKIAEAMSKLLGEMDQEIALSEQTHNEAETELKKKYAAFLNQADDILLQKEEEAKAAQKADQETQEHRQRQAYAQRQSTLLSAYQEKLARVKELKKDRKKLKACRILRTINWIICFILYCILASSEGEANEAIGSIVIVYILPIGIIAASMRKKLWNKYQMYCSVANGIFKRHKQIKAMKTYLDGVLQIAETESGNAAAQLGR